MAQIISPAAKRLHGKTGKAFARGWQGFRKGLASVWQVKVLASTCQTLAKYLPSTWEGVCKVDSVSSQLGAGGVCVLADTPGSEVSASPQTRCGRRKRLRPHRHIVNVDRLSTKVSQKKEQPTTYNSRKLLTRQLGLVVRHKSDNQNQRITVSPVVHLSE